VLENRLSAVAGIVPGVPVSPAESAGPLQPLIDTLREAVQQHSERALAASLEEPAAATAPMHSPWAAAEYHLEAASASVEIYERLVQLESMAAPSMLLDWNIVKQAAIDAARRALGSAEALLPSLRDASTIARIKTAAAEIEAKLTGKPVATEK
jgi:hypothetical protein